jgi:hypothetical protein
MNNKSLKKWIKECIKQALTENFREPPKVDRILTRIYRPEFIRDFMAKSKNSTLLDITNKLLEIAESLAELTKNNPTPKEISDVKSKIEKKPSFLSLKNSPLTKDLTIKIDEALQDIYRKLDVTKDPSSLVGKVTETHNDLVKLAFLIRDNEKDFGLKANALQSVLNLGMKDRMGQHPPHDYRAAEASIKRQYRIANLQANPFQNDPNAEDY